ncbi:MAG: intradiol ring-cleavage dioxygenase [Bacteroidota bacterium]
MRVYHLLIVFFLFISCEGHSQGEIGGPCQGCEAIYEYGDRILTAIDTLPGFQAYEPKLVVEGRVFQKDGVSPADGVILYVYHTNQKGIYETREGAKGWASRHGYIRGWVKTGPDGFYRFYTFKPAPYPDRMEPEHIHITVKEPDKDEYYLDSYFFTDDPLLTPEEIASHDHRGGSGVTMPTMINGKLTVKRNIILGKNIPNYP